jgi:putative ABC transport system ATP-binding protein
MTQVAEPTAGGAVVCTGLVHVYPSEDGPVAALRNIDLDVHPGEVLAILGPSGSGKTTLLSLLSGLLRPTAGSVLIAGHDLGRLDERGLSQLRATELALVLQDPLRNLLPYATGLQNVAFAQRGSRRRRWPLRWEPAELVERLDLSVVANRPVHQLSAGEQARVAIASALATSPLVLLADEPTGRLDPEGRDAVVASLLEAHELSGATVIVVTHDSELASALPRSIAISHGAIGSEGRGDRRFAVVGRDGSLRLPAEVAAKYPPGTMFEVGVGESGLELRPATPDAAEDAQTEALDDRTVTEE